MSLAEAIRTAMGGRKNRAKARLEDERPEEIEDEEEDGAASEEDETEAEGDEPEEDAEGEDPDENAEDTDPEEEAEDEKTPDARKAHARGRRAERRRMASILGSTAAEANPGLAAHLAFGTSMKAPAALKALAAAGGGAKGKLASRMASARQPRLGGGAAAPKDARAATVDGVKSVMASIHRRNAR